MYIYIYIWPKFSAISLFRYQELLSYHATSLSPGQSSKAYWFERGAALRGINKQNQLLHFSRLHNVLEFLSFEDYETSHRLYFARSARQR